MAATGEWVLLAYRIPREPSTPRIAVWRKLRRLGAVQLLDGLVGLPSDSRSKERLEWIADEVVTAGGEASIWLAHPTTKAQARALATQMAGDVETEYDELVNAATGALDESPGTRKRTVARLRRDLAHIRQRDHFPKRGYERATSAINRVEASVAKDELAGRR